MNIFEAIAEALPTASPQTHQPVLDSRHLSHNRFSGDAIRLAAETRRAAEEARLVARIRQERWGNVH